MKTKTSLMAILMVSGGLILAGCVSNEGFHSGNFGKSDQTNSVDYHMTAIEHHDTKAKILEAKIQNLQKRITTFTQKPYLDPKGLRRSGWKLLKGTWQKEVNELREQITWHANELARLQASANEHSTITEESVI